MPFIPDLKVGALWHIFVNSDCTRSGPGIASLCSQWQIGYFSRSQNRYWQSI